MHGHAGFAAAGRAHHAHDPIALGADGGVLLRLNGGDDLLHVAAGGAGKNVQKHSVVDIQLGIHIIIQPAVHHAILTLQGHFSTNHARGTAIFHIARHGIVKQAANRRAPVVHHDFALLIFQAVQADDDFFQFVLALFHKIHPGEEGAHEHAAIPGGHVLRKGLPGGKAIDFRRKLLQIRGRKGRGAHAQIFPRVRNNGANGFGMAARKQIRLFDDRQQQFLHLGRILSLLFQVRKLFHFSSIPPNSFPINLIFSKTLMVYYITKPFSWKVAGFFFPEKQRAEDVPPAINLPQIQRPDFPAGSGKD